MVILDLARRTLPELPVYFLDTGFHFQETLDFAERIRREWKLKLIVYRPKLFGAAFAEQFGDKLYESDPDLCCHKNKVEPFAELLARHQGWIAGIRRDQANTRADAEAIEILEENKLKIQPLVHWTRAMVDAYIEEHAIPLHPLLSQGYTSIGCAPCTKPCVDPADERAGRWAGTQKTECGLHLFWKKRGGAKKPAPASLNGEATPLAPAPELPAEPDAGGGRIAAPGSERAAGPA
jgi:phosphoadenosine phosphosulfate reductase